VDLLKGLSSIFGFNKNYNYFSYDILGGASFSRMKMQKVLELVIANPAMIKVIALQCDMFSLGKFYYYEKDKEKDMPEEVAKVLKRPNYQDNIRQFLWDWMFWNMLGNSWIYVRDKNFPDTTKMFVLNPFEMDFPTVLKEQGLILSSQSWDNLQEKTVNYCQQNGMIMKIPFGELMQFMDLTNSAVKDINGLSRLDSLYKVILNSEEVLKSKNINTKFSGKFIVAGRTDAMDVTKRMLGEKEKDDIETKIEDGDKNIHAVKSMVEIRRFVDNMKSMELSQSYLADYAVIGGMYNIPRDVLEANQSSTYENQEKARSSHIAYCLDPKGQELSQGITDFFGLVGEIVMSWDHLPFVQVMEKEREETKAKKLANLKSLLELGIDQKEALAFVDLKFKKFLYEKSKPNPATQEQAPAGGVEPETETVDTGEDQQT